MTLGTDEWVFSVLYSVFRFYILSAIYGEFIFIRPFEKRDVLCYGVWRPSVNFFVSG